MAMCMLNLEVDSGCMTRCMCSEREVSMAFYIRVCNVGKRIGYLASRKIFLL